MCGRFARFSPAHVFRMLFQLNEFIDFPPQYNISPGQDIYAVRGIIMRDEQARTTSVAGNFEKEVVLLRWGLIPFWTKDPTIGNRMINSRSDTVTEKPSFKTAFKNHRCLVPTDGFYEWQKQKDGGKQPYFIRMKSEEPFAFAGIWDKWKSSEEHIIESCSILTTEPNSLLKPIHNRMPVIIDPSDFDQWLNPSNTDIEQLKTLLKPFDAKKMDAYPVSTYVNNPLSKDKQCILKVEGKSKQQKLF
ncbi:MAG: SOS response-associated peptidase [Candidatus Heimdallarchaeota archaeon]|nr:SOS response-associated peptidase [Candidatus Heimdallarchaeota archaeon]